MTPATPLPTPCISVVVPTFNRGAAVTATVDSALAQDLAPGDVEFLIVDDGSTDDTFAVLERAYGNDPHVRLFQLSHGGVAAARNFGLQQARGEFIAFLDHDDEWLPEKLRLQLEVFKQHPEAGVVYCRWHEEDGDGRELVPLPIWWSDEDVHPPRGWVQKRLLVGNFVISMTIPLVRTSLLRACGGFDARMVPCDDWDVWLRLSALCPFEMVPHFLARYRRYAGQQSSNRAAMRSASRITRRKHRRLYLAYFLSTPRVMVRAYADRVFHKTRVPFHEPACAALERQDRRAALRIFKSAIKTFPLVLVTPQWWRLAGRIVLRRSS